MSKQFPSKTKYRKVQKGRNRGIAKGASSLAFGDYALQSLSRGDLTSAQLEAVRVSISRHLKRRGKIWFRVFPHLPRTRKPAETRMGKGKGGVEFYVAVIKPGSIICELAGVPESLAREAMRLADAKVGLRCRFLSRTELEQY
jgi:large subunit ribosomal protein L16